MNVLGIGMLFSRGLGIQAFEHTLQIGWQKPDAVALSEGKILPAFLANLETVPDKSLLKKVRRADKLSKMAVLAAADALGDSGLPYEHKKTGIILATAFGAHVTTFDFLDGILDYGDAAVSPTTFSNSVHNAAASYISSSLGIQGPTLTVTQFRFSFSRALELAKIWLNQKRCDYILVGAVDQYGDVLGYVSDKKSRWAEDGKIRPFLFNPTCAVPGEGAVFFLMSNTRGGNDYCTVDIDFAAGQQIRQDSAEVTIIDADGMYPDESVYRTAVSPDVRITAYSPLFGSTMNTSAFHLAAAALMMKRQVLYAAPEQSNPHNLNLLTKMESASIRTIRCIGFNCSLEQVITTARVMEK
ncbi:MAG: beta-ketoacyl synthase N-terminal-like domain-containing protein [Nitrospirota bacterium]